MADGTKKPISKVKVGDKVKATDPETGETAARPVVAVIRHGGVHRMVDLTLADGTVLHATDGHPIWDATTRRFTKAIHLRPGHQVLAAGDRRTTILATRVHTDNLTAYNLQIADIHTYYAGTTPTLVHNSCGSLADRLAAATQWKGRRLPEQGGPANGILVKRGPLGEVTNYSEYDGSGLITKRVDLSGRTHGPLPTPHVVDYVHDVSPSGEVFPRDLRPRLPTGNEMP